MAINVHRIVRVITTCSWALVVSGGALVGALAGAVIGALLSSPTHQPDVTIQWALIGALAMLAPQIWLEYKRKTYDPTLIFTFDKRFFSPEMKEIRSKAATSLLQIGETNQRDEKTTLPEVEDVLDFFEDLGFYVKGHQISPEVVHHTFYYWIRGYYTAARNYIERSQEGEPAGWENIPRLFAAVHRVEISRSRGKDIKTLSKEGIDKFLNNEKAEWSDDTIHS